MTRFLTAVSFGLILTSACVDTDEDHATNEPSGLATQSSTFAMEGLDGASHQVTYGELVQTADGARWDTLVSGETYLIEFRADDTQDVLAVFGPQGRLLYQVSASDSINIYQPLPAPPAPPIIASAGTTTSCPSIGEL